MRSLRHATSSSRSHILGSAEHGRPPSSCSNDFTRHTKASSCNSRGRDPLQKIQKTRITSGLIRQSTYKRRTEGGGSEFRYHWDFVCYGTKSSNSYFPPGYPPLVVVTVAAILAAAKMDTLLCSPFLNMRPKTREKIEHTTHLSYQ